MNHRDQKMFFLGEDMPIRYLREKAMQSTDTAEIIGLCKGVVADKRVNEREAKMLLKWVNENQESLEKWPCNLIYQHIAVALSDNYLDLKEQQELLFFLSRICGEGNFEGRLELSKNIPYDSVSHLSIKGTAFCLTGEFAAGTRASCQKMIQQCGGTIKTDPIKNSILVVGTIANPNWKYGQYGNKIKKAIEYRERGFGVTIVPEDVLIEALGDNI